MYGRTALAGSKQGLPLSTHHGQIPKWSTLATPLRLAFRLYAAPSTYLNGDLCGSKDSTIVPLFHPVYIQLTCAHSTLSEPHLLQITRLSIFYRAIVLYCIMCRFVVPIRTCSKCHQNQPLFDEKERRLSHANEKIERKPTYTAPPQDCYSRWCIFSSEHPITCNSCRFTCKQTHGKTREIQGGSPSYVCHSCASCSQQHSPCKPPRGMRNGVLRRWETGWFTGLTKSSAK